LNDLVAQFASNPVTPAHSKSKGRYDDRAMQVVRWFSFVGLIAFCADTALYGGVHADSIIYLVRNVGRGVLLGALSML
jgi:hypothetical protein